MAGRLDVMFVSPGSISGQLKEKQLRPIAVASDTRIPSLPDVPTLAEVGVKDVALDVWFGLAAPAGTPTDVITKLSAAFSKAAQSSGVQAKAEAIGVKVQTLDPSAFSTFIKDEIAKMDKLVKSIKS